MKVSYDMVSDIYGYGTEKTSQASSKPFTIPTEEIPSEKPAQTKKADPGVCGKLSYVGKFDKSDPFGTTEAFNNMLTKTTPTRSDEEILKDIEELAKEHAKTGKFQDDQKFTELMYEFISSVSPDRKSIIENSNAEINERIASETYPGKLDEEDKKEKKELIDYFIEAIGTGTSKDKEKYDNDIISNNIATRGNYIAAGENTPYNITSVKNNGDHTVMELNYGGGKTTTLTYDKISGELVSRTMEGNVYRAGNLENNVIKVASYYDDNGEWVASYGNDKFNTLVTKAEAERSSVILGVYNAAYDVAYGRHLPNSNQTYHSTYERLTSEIA